MNDHQQITPQEALDWLRDWERQAFGRRGEWYARIIACFERLVAERTICYDAICEIWKGDEPDFWSGSEYPEADWPAYRAWRAFNALNALAATPPGATEPAPDQSAGSEA